MSNAGGPCKGCGVETDSHHSVMFGGGDFWMCCRCHVLDGNSPADWHPECIKAAMEKGAEDQRRN